MSGASYRIENIITDDVFCVATRHAADLNIHVNSNNAINLSSFLFVCIFIDWTLNAERRVVLNVPATVERRMEWT